MIPKNTGFLMTPHWNTQTARIAMKDQSKSGKNQIVICCSPSWNGVYTYDNEVLNDCSRIMNGKLPCYEIPLASLKKVKELDEVHDADVLKKIKDIQKKYKEKGWKN